MRNWLNKIKCKIFGHNPEVVDVSTTGATEKFYCQRCNRFFGMNHDAKAVLFWDSELEQCFVASNKRHSKWWPKHRKWLEYGDYHG